MALTTPDEPRAAHRKVKLEALHQACQKDISSRPAHKCLLSKDHKKWSVYKSDEKRFRPFATVSLDSRGTTYSIKFAYRRRLTFCRSVEEVQQALAEAMGST